MKNALLVVFPMLIWVVDSRRPEYNSNNLYENYDSQRPTSLGRRISEQHKVYNLYDTREALYKLRNETTIAIVKPTTSNEISAVNRDSVDTTITSSLNQNDSIDETVLIESDNIFNSFELNDDDTSDPEESIGRINNVYNNDLLLPPLRTPFVYRYYPRHQSRTITAGSIPFVLLGPNVDHWKLVAQQLSSRGFNVIAVGPKDEITTSSRSTQHNINVDVDRSRSAIDRYLEGPTLVLQLLDALRWTKIILVGCDYESTLAIQAALLLPSDRMAGLILCGNLEDSEKTFVPSGYNSYPTSNYRANSCNPFELDRFLHERLNFPFTIIWDGTNEKLQVSSTSTDSTPYTILPSLSGTIHRSVIIGGGSAPHRRRPGIFAWILTRFVEEKIAPSVPFHATTSSSSATKRTSRYLASKDSKPNSSLLPAWLLTLPIWNYPARIPALWHVDDVFNEESMVVFGRIVATAIFYAVSLKVLVYQYGNILDGIDLITSTPRIIASVIRNRIADAFSFLIMVGRVPSMLLPFWCIKSQRNKTEYNILEGSTDNETCISSSDDVRDESEQMNDEKTIEPKQDSGFRPFFFLDHVVA
jgi:hypothetical protein